MDILIIAQYMFDIDHIESTNGRFTYLARLLKEEGHQVEIATSCFIHNSKTKSENCPNIYHGVKITTLYEPGYPKNVCLERFGSHHILAQSLKKYLSGRKNPDVIYCAIPSLDVAVAAADYCNRNHVRFIVDIQDLWPEAFRMVFNIPVASDVIFAPMQKSADFVYSSADEIVAVSETYVKRGLSVNKKCRDGHSVFLGTDLDVFDENSKRESVVKKEDGELWLGYCGTLGSSYDLTCVFDALNEIRNSGENPPRFIVMGDGPRKEEFEQYAGRLNLNVTFTGMLLYEDMCAVLSDCDMVVNPISHGAAQSIINKHADYAASGLPVLNTQEGREYRKLVYDYKMGFNCPNNDSKELAKKIMKLCKNEKLRIFMGRNARRCAEEKFDRKHTYKEIVGLF